MEESPGWLIDSLDLKLPTIADQHSPLALMTLALPVNSNIFIQNMNVGNQETASSASSNTLTLSHLSLRKQYKSASISHDEHQPSWSGDAKSEPLLRKNHTKSRSGCSTCKKRRIKVLEAYQITRQKTNAHHSVQRIIQSALNVANVASNVHGRRFPSAKQE